jgi:hypothetical protein
MQTATPRRRFRRIADVPAVAFVADAALVAILALGVAVASPAVGAVTAERKGADAVVPPADRPAGRAPDATSGSPAAAPDGGPLLRCWQYGRLILEEPVSGSAVTVPGVALQLRGRGDARNVQLLDLRTATCVIR